MLKLVGAAAAVAASMLVPGAATAQAPAAIEWEIAPRSKPEPGTVQFSLTFRHEGNGKNKGRSQNSGPRRLAELQGLDFAQLASAAPVPVRFRLSGDAGALDCSGTARQERGSGTCAFAASSTYADAIAGQGLGRPSAVQQLHMMLHKVTLGYVGELRSLGAAPRDLDKLIGMAIHDVTPDYVRGLQRAGYSGLTADELTGMAIHDVTPEYVAELGRLGYARLPAKQLMAMAIHNVDTAFVREMRRLGIGPATADELVALSIHNVNAAYVKSMAGLGYTKLTADQLLAMSIHRVTPDYVRSLQTLGYSGLSADMLVTMRIHKVTPEFIRSINRDGGRLNADDLVRRRIHGGR